jgi:hypothetical protein
MDPGDCVLPLTWGFLLLRLVLHRCVWMDSMQASGGWAISELVDQVTGQLSQIAWGKGLIGQLHTQEWEVRSNNDWLKHHCLLDVCIFSWNECDDWFFFSSLDIVLKTMPFKLTKDILKSELVLSLEYGSLPWQQGLNRSQGCGGDLNSGSGINWTVAVHTVFHSDTYICWEIKCFYVKICLLIVFF